MKCVAANETWVCLKEDLETNLNAL